MAVTWKKLFDLLIDKDMANDTKKEKERDELRGAVEGWDFKNYALGTMFYGYVSENLAGTILHLFSHIVLGLGKHFLVLPPVSGIGKKSQCKGYLP